jgi:ketosteroid isomerase-like protein
MSNNLNSVNSIYKAFGEGNIPFIIDQLAENVQWEQWSENSAQAAGVPWLQYGKGKEAALRYFQTIGALNFKEFNVLSVMGNDKQFAVEYAVEAEIPATGKSYRDEAIHLWTFNEEGKVSRMRHYTDTAKIIEANRK